MFRLSEFVVLLFLPSLWPVNNTIVIVIFIIKVHVKTTRSLSKVV